jgi:hypothetical protein
MADWRERKPTLRGSSCILVPIYKEIYDVRVRG